MNGVPLPEDQDAVALSVRAAGHYLCQQLGAARKARGMTVWAVAEHFCVFPEDVEAWENGTKIPGANILPAICGLYGVPMGFFFLDTA